MVLYMSKTNAFAYELIQKYHTKDPFYICKKNNINVVKVDLPEIINSFSLRIFEKDVILINNKLSECNSLLACSKEMAYILINGNKKRALLINYNNDNSETYYDDFAKCFVQSSEPLDIRLDQKITHVL